VNAERSFQPGKEAEVRPWRGSQGGTAGSSSLRDRDKATFFDLDQVARFDS
jgi:hypothetical protein